MPPAFAGWELGACASGSPLGGRYLHTQLAWGSGAKQRGGCGGEAELLLPANLLASLRLRCRGGWGGLSSSQRPRAGEGLCVGGAGRSRVERQRLEPPGLGWSCLCSGVGAESPKCCVTPTQHRLSSRWPEKARATRGHLAWAPAAALLGRGCCGSAPWKVGTAPGVLWEGGQPQEFAGVGVPTRAAFGGCRALLRASSPSLCFSSCSPSRRIPALITHRFAVDKGFLITSDISDIISSLPLQFSSCSS